MFKITSAGIGIALSLVIGSLPAAAQNASFQNYFFNVCNNPTGQLATLCGQTPGANGGLASDSQESLNPSQVTGGATQALADTRARIQAALGVVEERREGALSEDEGKDEKSTMQVFRMDGYSLLVNVRYDDERRDRTAEERAFDANTFGIQVGADYRISDNFLVGALLGLDARDSRFDQDLPAVAFTPNGGSEGDTNAITTGLTLFTTGYVLENLYLEGLLGASLSSYDFTRNAVFLETTRATPQTNINTSGETDGYQLTAALGAGYDVPLGPWMLGASGRLTYAFSHIDGYAETGGSGLAMAFSDSENTSVTSVLGVRASRAFSTDLGVFSPQVWLDYTHAFRADASEVRARFLQDAGNNSFLIRGYRPDKDYATVGLALSLTLPEGVSTYLSYDRDLGRAYTRRERFAAGLRAEF